MPITISENVYGLTESGKKVKIGTVSVPDPDIKAVGGKIFYIDSTASGATYVFYDQNGDVLDDVAVGDAPYAYKVTGTPAKEKYYVANSDLTKSGKWTYRDVSQNQVRAGVENGAIGAGKENTETVLTIEDGAYDVSGTIWHEVSVLNANDSDNNDWYIPSRYELAELLTATGSDDTPIITEIPTSDAWSSTEKELGTVYAGDAYRAAIDQPNGSLLGKTNVRTAIFVRSF